MIILVTVSHLCVLYNFVSSFPAISYDVKGITYSVMSASWDSDTEGSALGFDEFSSNLDNIKDGLKRSKENILIREQMAGMPEAEIQAAIKSLDEKDKRAAKKKMSFEEKLDS